MEPPASPTDATAGGPELLPVPGKLPAGAMAVLRFVTDVAFVPLTAYCWLAGWQKSTPLIPKPALWLPKLVMG